MLRISPASILYSNTDKLSGPKLMWDGQENDRNVLCWGEFKLQHVFGKNTIKYQGQNPEANIEKRDLQYVKTEFFFSHSHSAVSCSHADCHDWPAWSPEKDNDETTNLFEFYEEIIKIYKNYFLQKY